jgi:hypothetical protein
LQDVPGGPRAHFESALAVARAQHHEVQREVDVLAKILLPMGIPVVLLKGAAYVVARRSAARGRLLSDIDVLVPRERIAEVESALMLSGWASTHHSAYDQRYYREWMHELPPLRHVKRGTTLDVHHAILPLTARLRPDSTLLLAATVPAADDPGIRTLCPVDMVLHSMTHLFLNEEFSHGLRDLSDLDLLLREFGPEPAFWEEIATRAASLDLTRPLFYGLRQTSALLGTPVPEAVVERIRAWGPAASPAMDALWSRALGTHHPTVRRPLTATALFLLYLRGHWLRMPPAQLARHLATKAFMRIQPDSGAG